MNSYTAAARAKNLLHTAARRLQTADPARELGDIIDQSLPLPVGDPGYRGQQLPEPSFREASHQDLSFEMSTGGPGCSSCDRTESAIDAMQRVVGRNFGSEAVRWMNTRVAPVRGQTRYNASFGGLFGSGFDRNGVSESHVSVEWGPGLMDALPPALFQLAKIAVESLPGLRPALSTIRCGRKCGSQQLTFDIDFALALSDLKPMMERFGLGGQHAGLMTAVALILGARFTLPPGSSTMTIRPARSGVEMRLDVHLDQIPDPPSQLMSLLRLQMTERPRSLQALDRWLMALTPDGFDSPGSFSLLSVRVNPNMQPRLSLNLRSASFDTSPVPANGNNAANAITPEAAPATV